MEAEIFPEKKSNMPCNAAVASSYVKTFLIYSSHSQTFDLCYILKRHIRYNSIKTLSYFLYNLTSVTSEFSDPITTQIFAVFLNYLQFRSINKNLQALSEDDDLFYSISLLVGFIKSSQ